jgi:hypothetical protein
LAALATASSTSRRAPAPIPKACGPSRIRGIVPHGLARFALTTCGCRPRTPRAVDRDHGAGLLTERGPGAVGGD